MLSPVVFGTRNGYDVDGGTDPICWESSVSPKPPPALNGTGMGTSDTLDTIQTNLYGNNASQAELLQECFNGTAMNIEPIDWVRMEIL